MPGRKIRILLLAGLVTGLVATSAHAGNDKKKPELINGASAEMLAAQCDGCHGPTGASGGPAIPNIGGNNPEYLVEQMKGFASGEIPSTIMGRIAKGYTEDEVKRLAAHYGKQKWVPAKQKFDPALAREGAKLHEKYCEKCHENGGKKADEDVAILAGQWLPYLHFTMTDFISGRREMTKKMRKKVKKLLKKKGEKGLKAVLEFYASQQ